ncbi:nonribosomal peptide synthetase [Basidiobolus ranarum]|uniref:Nonribosomal peptide synthetase n=1 Tax=Basidiobolus ranarum TaxID=34480 RepID=A0ABR2VMP3_9FUNG
MEEMVDIYTAAIRKTQPEGPYVVAGYSHGGVVVYEIAKRLEAQNQRVAFVGLVNIPPHIY